MLVVVACEAGFYVQSMPFGALGLGLLSLEARDCFEARKEPKQAS